MDKYFISIKEFRQGHLVESYTDDNNQAGFSLERAREIIDEIDRKDPLKGGGDESLQGTEAYICDWNGQRVS